jgi:hypothetical protein
MLASFDLRAQPAPGPSGDGRRGSRGAVHAGSGSERDAVHAPPSWNARPPAAGPPGAPSAAAAPRRRLPKPPASPSSNGDWRRSKNASVWRRKAQQPPPTAPPRKGSDDPITIEGEGIHRRRTGASPSAGIYSRLPSQPGVRRPAGAERHRSIRIAFTCAARARRSGLQIRRGHA